MRLNVSSALPPDLDRAVEETAKQWETSGGTERLWKKDASLWSNSGEERWLGWLDIVDQHSQPSRDTKRSKRR